MKNKDAKNRFFDLKYLYNSERKTETDTYNQSPEIYRRLNEIIDKIICKLPYFWGDFDNNLTDKGEHQYFCSLNYMQAPYTFWQIISLYRKGYYLEAIILCRNLFETIIQMKYFYKYPYKITDDWQHECRFINPDTVKNRKSELFKDSENNKSIRVVYGELKIGVSKQVKQSFYYVEFEWTAEEARQHCMQNNGKFYKTNRKNFKMMFEEFAPGFYDKHYPIFCEAAHGTGLKIPNKHEGASTITMPGCHYDVRKADFICIYLIILLYAYISFYSIIYDKNSIEKNALLYQEIIDSKNWLKRIMQDHQKINDKSVGWYDHIYKIINNI